MQETDLRYTTFVHLVGPENRATGEPLWAQYDSEPCHGFYATSSWAAGEIIADNVDLTVPDDAPAGSYTLAMGFYEPWSGQRLPVEGESVTKHSVVVLAETAIGSPDL